MASWSVPVFKKTFPFSHKPPPFDFNEDRFHPDDLKPFFADQHYPSRVIFFQPDGNAKTFWPEPSIRTSDRTLFVSDHAAVQQVKDARDYEEQVNSLQNNSELPDNLFPLSKNEYSVMEFREGLCDDGSQIDLPVSLQDSVIGPDFSVEPIDRRSDPVRFNDNKAKVVSFGHGGEMILAINEKGFILDRPGADFVIYENPFYYPPGLLYQEFAHVGVSETLRPSDVVWFSCDPDHNVIKGCAGVVPTAEGGDRFDLASVGVKKANYIWIKDWGKNHNLPRSKNTEGFDLDALEVIHGYRTKN